MPNFWDNLMGDDAHAAEYMETYGEGIGSDTRHTIGSFINDGESVLDVGCGPGWNFDHFREHGPRIGKYKGIDYSERFIRVANERFNMKYPSTSRDNIAALYLNTPFTTGDCRNIKERDKTWDVVILQDCLEHTNGYEIPIQEALRVARKRVIVSFWHLDDTDNPHINDDGDDGWGAWYDKRKWESYLSKLPCVWFDTESSPDANRKHLFYILDKEIMTS